jgi:hypothetical protein
MNKTLGISTIARYLLRTLVICSLFVIGVARSTSADTVYTYTGKTFNTFSNNYACAGSCNVSGSFTVATAFGANLNDFTFTPLSFSFTDGHQTLTQADVTYPAVPFEHFSTDASGAVTTWRIDLSNSPISGYILSTEKCDVAAGSGGPISCGTPFWDLAGPITDYTFTSEGYIDSQPGTWSSTTSPVPEPSSLLLLGTGLAGVFGAIRRKLMV